MDHAARALHASHQLYARAEPAEERPPAYKAIGIALAVTSGCFIGVSFVLKKVGLLKANDKYNEVAGEGYGYLKNFHWWGGMTLMIIGELCNFAAFAFTDAILVTSLGATSVVICAVLSAIFLKERLSMVGKVSCFLCIVGSVVIVLNAPAESSVSTIQELQKYVVTPGFLTYAGVIIVASLFGAFWVGPRYGKKNMFTYISICSWIGGLSVVATQGLGAAIVAQAGGTPQFNQWFLYIVLVFVIATLLTEIVYLNKALNIFNAAMVTPTYYVYFTSTTIITSAVLFQGFKGTPVQIVTVVFGFLTICAGVVLLQLSKSAKDVPDSAVFTGDLNQIQTIAEQEQPETEPKADALRGTAAILRKISNARMKMEHDEFKRLQEEKEAERLAPVSEDGQPIYEWDGLRRRRTTVSSQRSSRRPPTAPSITSSTPVHPPLGMSRFPTAEEMEEERRQQMSPSMLSSIAGTIRGRARTMVLPGHPDYPQQPKSPLHEVQLSDMAHKNGSDPIVYATDRDIMQSPPPGLQHSTEYSGAAGVAGSGSRHIQILDPPRPGTSASSLEPPPTPPLHGVPESQQKRQFSFSNVFRRHGNDGSVDSGPQSPSRFPAPRLGTRPRGFSERSGRSSKRDSTTEEERLGLVHGDTSVPPLAEQDESYDDDNESNDSDVYSGAYSDDQRQAQYGRGITYPPRGRSISEEIAVQEHDYDEALRMCNDSRGGTPSRATPPDRSITTPPPPAHGSRPSGGGGAGGGVEPGTRANAFL